MDNNNQPYTRSIGLVEADVEENCKQHGSRGILDHNDILRIISEYDEEDRQARIFGKFQHLTGLVFKQFNRAVHVIKPFDINERDFVVIEALDSHPRTPDAVMWGAIDRWGRVIICDEIFSNFDGSGELGTKVKFKCQNYRLAKRIIDPSARIQDQHSGRSLWTDLYAQGLNYADASKRRHLGIRTIKDALNFQISAGQFVKAPRLYIFETCVRTIWEMEHWQWQEWRGKTGEYRNANEKPVDKDDHMMENLGRILMENIQFTELVQEQQLNRQAEAYSQQIATADDPYRAGVDEMHDDQIY